MERTFQTKALKQAAFTSYIGMHAGILAFTATLPLTLLAMGEGSDLQILALHCYSMKTIQHWLLGAGGITFLLETLSVIAAMARNKSFRLIVACLLGLFMLLTIALIIWGCVETEGRKSYFQETWNDMSDDTKYFIQTYFSCCGFENINEWNSGLLPVPSSCYAIPSQNVSWPDGCYKRATMRNLDLVTVTNSGGNLESVGKERANPFLVSQVVSLVFLMVVQLVSLIMIVRGILMSPKSNTEANGEAFVLENSAVALDENLEKNGGVSTITETDDIEEIDIGNGHSISNGRQNHDPKKEEAKTKPVLDDKTSLESKKVWHETFTDTISSGFGNGFYWVGVRVARHPKMTILYSVLLTLTMTVGMLQRYEVPSSSASGFLADDNKMVAEAILAAKTFQITQRDQYILVLDETNVISSENFQRVLNMDKSVKALTSSAGSNFSTICLKINEDCRERSLFEFWSFDTTILEGLTSSEILSEINNDPLTSPVFGDDVDVSHILGGIVRSQSNEVISARAHLLHYVTTSLGQNWEDLFVEVGRASYDGVSVYVQAHSSRSKEASSETTKELPLLFAGFGLIFVYIIIMAGKLSRLEHRVYIALLGVTAAGLAMAGGIGLTPSFGLKWTTMHLIVPFLAIGIGVDDMFVILQAWNSVEDDDEMKNKSLEEKAGLALKMAGVSITVTSVTDLVAFAVGATSELGGFASFSVFTAMSIILLFFMQCTFFMACVVLDHKRKDRRYDACLACCYKLKDTYEPGKCSRREIFPTFFEDGLGRLVTKLPFAIIAILATLGFTGTMAWGFYKLQVIYDPDWYLPVGSYLAEFNKQYDIYFNVGSDAAAYVIDVDFFAEREKLHTLYENLRSNADLDNRYLTSWFEDFVTWSSTTNRTTNIYASDAYASAAEFYSDVREFLLTSGRKHAYNVAFKSDVMLGSRFDIRHKVVENEGQNVDIMETVRASCEAANFSTAAFPYGRFYLLYEITRIIKHEVYRNLGITLLCVFIMVLPILTSLQMGIWVSLCVVFTTIDVAGTMYFAGLSIEASTIITLLLSVGLAVDYAAHVGHKFLTLKGTRKRRARVAVGQIGLAVFNGGFSTFLALVMLSGSDTYSFKVFFTVFSSVIGYGLWNGLVFLPCILSIVGPPPNSVATEAKLSSRHYKSKRKVRSKVKMQRENEEEQ